MSQVSVNVVAPLGYTGPTLPGNNSLVQIVDTSGNPVLESGVSDVTVNNNLKVNNILPRTGTTVNVNGVPVSAPATNNVAMGVGNLQSLTTGTNNTAVGNGSGSSLTTGIQNTSLGFGSLLSTTTGIDNTAVGVGALTSNTTGQRNVAIGKWALRDNTTTSLNVAIGHQSMQNSVGKSQSVAIGYDSLRAGATNSVAIGGAAGSASNNPIVAVGHLALQLSTGTGNTAVGSIAGSQITTGSSNTLIGQSAGTNNLTTGSNNTCLGAFAGGFVDTGSNNTCIGYQAQVSGTGSSDEFVLGNANVAILSCAVTSITSLSDARDKKDIEELPVGLDFVNGLKPVTFTWNDRNEDGKHDIADFGFIAQDLKKSQEDAGLADTLKLVYENNPEKLQASYGKLVPILVKAIQDLSKEVETLKNK
jgi:hypothetical protein